MRYGTIIFDMDGTILDTLEDMKDAVNTTLEHFGFETISYAQTRAYVGNGIARLIRLALPEGVDEDCFQRVLSYYKEYYESHCRIKTKEYEGMSAMLTELKRAGAKLAVVSNKPDPAVKELAGYFFPGLFHMAVGERAGVRRKPAPDSVNAVIAAMGAERSDCVYIGDSEVDVATAANAELDCISVTWGFRDRETLEESGAKLLIASVEELKNYLI